MEGLEATAAYLHRAIEDSGHFEVLSQPRTVPLVCFRLHGQGHGYSVFDIAAHLRQRGWIVPAYTLAPDAQDLAVLRVVVKENFSRDMANMLVDDLSRTVALLDRVGPAHLGTEPARPGPGRIPGGALPRETRHQTLPSGTHGVC
jgi:glutamate decarboxylase